MLRFQHILPTLKGVEGLIPYDKNGISIQPLLMLPTLKGLNNDSPGCQPGVRRVNRPPTPTGLNSFDKGQSPCLVNIDYLLIIIFRAITHSAMIKFNPHPTHATTRYTSIGGNSTVLVMAYFQARRVIADKVRA